MSNKYIMELRNIEKNFPGVKALDKVNLKLRKQSVHALLGENGAGKSTLMKILSGVYSLEEGNILLDGESVEFANIHQSQEQGITIIHQELNLCWNLTVAENILLGREKLGPLNYYKRSENSAIVRGILERLGVDHINPDETVNNLSIANQQMVEIAKAISVNSRILIMDEPTSSLTEKEEKILFQIIRNIQQQGVSIIYISHKLDEIFHICDEVTVIRDGQWIDTSSIEKITKEKVIELMVGRPLNAVYPERKSDFSKNPVILDVRGLSKTGLISDINFQIRAGEILGVSGLVGAGRSEMAKTLFGRFRKDGGQVFIHGEEIDIKSPVDAIKAGMAFVTENRKIEGLTLGLSVKDNIMSSNLDLVRKFLGFIDTTLENAIATDGVNKLNVKTPSLKTPVQNLSGGNQQKVITSRWLVQDVKALILDEPTRGIDVGTKKAIYDIMRNLSESGIAILMISSELPEILGMSDRIAVMKGGRILDILDSSEASQEKIITLVTEG
ncbi:D-ribose transporter ATP-binding protein [Alkalispirochaeta odontotermitis]|nr:D-ribose transporter ATP-binding protein [Alkalispirochaeta odontotermitis]